MGPPPTETTDAINTSECNLTGEAGTAGLVHRGKKDWCQTKMWKKDCCTETALERWKFH